MKIVTPAKSQASNQANATRDCLAAAHCVFLFLALSIVGMHQARFFSPDEPAQSAAAHQARADSAQRLIVKSDRHTIDAIISHLELLSGSVVELVRSMSGNAHVVAFSEIHTARHVHTWIEQLKETGFIEYGQLDAPVVINTTSLHASSGFNNNAAIRVQPYGEKPNDNLYGEQWTALAPEVIPASINLERAWEITTGSADVTIAVIDTGVVFEHGDLNNRLHDGYDFVSGLNEIPETLLPVHSADNYLKANDGDGRDADASDPGDGVDKAYRDYMKTLGYDCPLGNSTWHGTAISSLLVANGNDSYGLTGVDWQAKVLPVRAIGKCGGNRSDLLDAIRWAAGVQDPGLPPNPNPARIINLSLGIDDVCGPADQQAINDAVNAGAIIVSAVGNHGRNTDLIPTAPSDCRHVIGVSAVNSDGSRAGYSNYGDDADIAAPGGNLGGNTHKILVATNADETARGDEDWHRYTTGTSVASPLVAGVLSLMLSVNPALNNTELENLLYASARPFMYVGGGDEQCKQSTCGVGMLDAYAAVQAAQNAIDNPPQIAAATVSDDFIITTGSGSFGCTVARPSIDGSSSPVPDPIWLLSLAAIYLFRLYRQSRCQARALQLSVRHNSRSKDVA